MNVKREESKVWKKVFPINVGDRVKVMRKVSCPFTHNARYAMLVKNKRCVGIVTEIETFFVPLSGLDSEGKCIYHVVFRNGDKIAFIEEEIARA